MLRLLQGRHDDASEHRDAANQLIWSADAGLSKSKSYAKRAPTRPPQFALNDAAIEHMQMEVVGHDCCVRNDEFGATLGHIPD